MAGKMRLSTSNISSQQSSSTENLYFKNIYRKRSVGGIDNLGELITQTGHSWREKCYHLLRELKNLYFKKNVKTP